MQRLTLHFRRPVRRQSAERYVLITLLSFAASVTVTRLFLAMTGYPQLGGGEFHIAHALWGGLFLFIAALLPLMIANRWVYTTGAILAGVGVGLFIDEVGKFITTSNNYFYPLAAPIVYGFFLLTVMIYLRVRRSHGRTVREELYRAFDSLEEVLEQDLDQHERDALEARLRFVAASTDRPDLAQLAVDLLEFLRCEALHLATHRPGLVEKSLERVKDVEERRLSRRRLRAILVMGLLGLGLVTVAKSTLALALLAARPGAAPLMSLVAKLAPIARAWQISAPAGVFRSTDLALEAAIGVLLLLSAALLLARRDHFATAFGSVGLLLSLTGVNLLSFYYEQFAGILTALVQLVLLIGVVFYRHRFVNPELAKRSWPHTGSPPVQPQTASQPPAGS
jgi:hypothetical protein